MDGLDPNERWTPDGDVYFVDPKKADSDQPQSDPR
jgi:hypothetical protein